MSKKTNWLLWVGVGIIVLIIMFKMFGREYFTTSNPIPTMADIDSLNTDNPTPVADSIVAWFQKNTIYPAHMRDRLKNTPQLRKALYQELSIFKTKNYFEDTKQVINSYYIRPTPKKFAEDIIRNVFKTTDEASIKRDSDFYSKIIESKQKNDKEVNLLYLLFLYLFGEPGAPIDQPVTLVHLV